MNCSFRIVFIVFVTYFLLLSFPFPPATAKRVFRDNDCDKDLYKHWNDEICWDDDENSDSGPESGLVIAITVGIIALTIGGVIAICLCCNCYCNICSRKASRSRDSIVPTIILPTSCDTVPKPFEPGTDQPNLTNTEFQRPIPAQYYQSESYQNPNGQYNEPPPPYSLIDEIRRLPGNSPAAEPTAPPS